MTSERAAQYTALVDDIQAFRHYIRTERGLAANTLLAYGRDLDRFSQWVAGGGLASYLAPSLRDLSHYLEFLRHEKLAPASVARHLVALKCSTASSGRRRRLPRTRWTCPAPPPCR